MQIAVTTAVWGRPLTTRLFWEGARRLQHLWAPHEVSIWAVGSEDVHRQLAARYGGHWVEHPNDELALKWNAVMEAAYRAGADYCVVLGSDDLLTDALAVEYRCAMEQGPRYFGVSSCVMIEPLTQRALRMTGHANTMRWGETIGAGRVLGRELLDRVEGRPWPKHATRGLDWRMTLKLQKHGISGTDLQILPAGDQALVDVKGAGMWSFEHVAQHTHVTAPDDYRRIVRLLSWRERRLIRKLQRARCRWCGAPHRI
jgi:hypothetical protein